MHKIFLFTFATVALLQIGCATHRGIPQTTKDTPIAREIASLPQNKLDEIARANSCITETEMRSENVVTTLYACDNTVVQHSNQGTTRSFLLTINSKTITQMASIGMVPINCEFFPSGVLRSGQLRCYFHRPQR